MQQKLIAYIKEEIVGNSEDVDLESDDDLLNSGLVDSIGIMRLIGFIEEEFGVKIPPQDMVIENFVTVDAIAEYLQNAKVQ